jgi:hypothetical protein
MSRASTLRHDRRLGQIGEQKPIRGADLDNATLNAGNAVTIWSKQVPADKVLWHGHGPDNNERAGSTFVYAELFANGNGGGTDGDNLTGDLELAITDSEQRDVVVRRGFGDLSTLKDAKSDNRTERPQLAAQAPFASQDRHIELRVISDSNSDGKEVANDSNMRWYYSKAPAAEVR